MLAQGSFLSFHSPFEGAVLGQLWVVLLLSTFQGTNRDRFLGRKWGEWVIFQDTVKEDSLGICLAF